MIDNEKAILVGMIVVAIFAALAGHEIGYQSGYEKGYEKGLTAGHNEIGYEAGWSDGIAYQAQVSYSTIVLGLVKVPSGYYIFNNNYGNFRINATNWDEALCELKDQISPCLICKEP